MGERQTERVGEREYCVRGLERTEAQLKVGILLLSLWSLLFSPWLHLLPLSFYCFLSLTIAWIGTKRLRTLREVSQPALHKTPLSLLKRLAWLSGLHANTLSQHYT